MVCLKNLKTSEAKYDILPVVLCGGDGTRLWPLSRKSYPKQFASLIGSKSLLELTFERAKDIAGCGAVLAIAQEGLRFLVQDAAEATNISCTCVLEPMARGTAAAMAAAALSAKGKQLLLFMPSDHYIPDRESFISTIEKGIASAKLGEFITFGVLPTHAHTGYGYIQIDRSSNGQMLEKLNDDNLAAISPGEDQSNDVIKISRFVEKPCQNDAAVFVSSGDYYWNSGIFLVRADVLSSALSKHAEGIFNTVKSALKGKKTIGKNLQLDATSYAKCEVQSIDCAVLEHYSNVSMVPFKGNWSDIGNWNSLAELIDADDKNNRIVGEGMAFDSISTYINAPIRPVVALGTNELLIVDTRDAVLVCAKTHAEKLKNVVAELQSQKLKESLQHNFSIRPWGNFHVLEEGINYKVKRLTINAGASISMQLHRHRSEHWVVVQGNAEVTRGKEIFILKENESIFIPLGIKHRISNPSAEILEIIEVQSGDYLEEDDIERFEDEYGRVSE